MKDKMEVEIAGKLYKKGYTTGSCAAAAAKAAVKMLLEQREVSFVEIETPAGIGLELKTEDCRFDQREASCAIRKDAGDDPDVTDGIYIYASVLWSEGKDVEVLGGRGVGVVTKPGLKVSVGQAAINPGPLEMIKKEVRKVTDRGIAVTIFVPDGEKTAEKTFNPRLGIEGGISIIGTSGIVTPMSEEAWKESVLLEMKMKRAEGFRHICFVFGNMGERFAVEELGISKEKIVIISNFVGYAMDSAVQLGFQSVLLVGHMGKLVKVAAGNFHTHSRISDARMETLCAFSAMEGAGKETIAALYQCVTTDGAEEIIEKNGLCGVYKKVADRAEERLRQRVCGGVETGCVLFDNTLRLLAKSSCADSLIER